MSSTERRQVCGIRSRVIFLAEDTRTALFWEGEGRSGRTVLVERGWPRRLRFASGAPRLVRSVEGLDNSTVGAFRSAKKLFHTAELSSHSAEWSSQSSE